MPKIEDISKETIVQTGTEIAKEIAERKEQGEIDWTASPEDGSNAYKEFWSEVKQDLTDGEIKILTEKEEELQNIRRMIFSVQDDGETITKFGRAKKFAIVEQFKIIDTVENPYESDIGGVAPRVVELMVSKNADEVIATSFGEVATQELGNEDIKFDTAEGKASDYLEEMQDKYPDLMGGYEELIRKPFKSPGGKKLLKKDILPLIIEHETYLEPFAGGASVFFAKEESDVEVLSDTDYPTYFMLKFLKQASEKDFEKLLAKNWRASKERFKKLKESEPTDRIEKFYKFFYLTRYSFNGMRTSYSGEPPIKEGNLKGSWEACSERLSDTDVLNQDYKKVSKKFDSENTFFYFDPPYKRMMDEDVEWSESINWDDFQEFLTSLKGDFLLSCYDTEEMRKLFSNFNIKSVKFKSTAPAGEQKQATELFVTNYDIEKLQKEATSGIYLTEPHGKMMYDDEKTAFIKSREFSKYIDTPIYLLSGKFAYGVIKYSEPREISIEEFKDLRENHKISKNERVKWWDQKEPLYYYDYEWIEKFDEPKRYEYPQGAQTFIKNPEFLKEDEPEVLTVDDVFESIEPSIQKGDAYAYLTGRVVNEGRIPLNGEHDIDILIREPRPIPAIESAIKNSIKDEKIRDLVEITWDQGGPLVGNAVPLFQKGFLKYPEQIFLAEEVGDLLTDTEIRDLTDDELREYHKNLHKSTDAFDMDELAENHALVINAFARRRIDYYPFDDELAEVSKKYESEYPTPFFASEDEINIGEPIAFMKPAKTAEFIQRWTSVYSDWVKKWLDEGHSIYCEEKFDGLDMQIHKKGDDVWIYPESREPEDRSDFFKNSVEELKEEFDDDFIIQAEMVWYKDEEMTEPHLRRDMVKFTSSDNPEDVDDSLVRFEVWDILALNDKDLRRKPLSERLRVLNDFLSEDADLTHWRNVPTKVAEDKEELKDLVKEFASVKGSEGTMLKVDDFKWERGVKIGKTDKLCLRGSTYILTENGFQRIMDIETGTKVFNENGELSPVIGKSRIDYKDHPEEVGELEVCGGINSGMTEDHKIFTKQGWIEAREAKNEIAVFPELEIPKENPPQELEFDWHGYKKTIDCDSSFWKLIGFWVAEGSLGNNVNPRYNRGEFELSQSDRETIDKYARIWESHFSTEPRLYTYPKENQKDASSLQVWDKPFCGWISNHFLDHECNKTIPWFINSLDKDKFKSFLDGYIEGDGEIKESGSVQTNSSDKGLAGRLFAVLRNKEDVALSYKIPRKGRGSIGIHFWKNFSKKHILDFHPNQMKKKSGLYDIELEEGNGFCGGNVVFHNSKFKNLLEMEVIVTDKYIVKSKETGKPLGTFNYEASVGPLTQEQAEKFNPDELRTVDDKTYAHIGQTYNTDVELDVGDIATCAPVMVYHNETDDGWELGWMFPTFISARPEREEPDDLDFVLKWEKVGSGFKSLEKLEDKIYLLDPCPHWQEDYCPLRDRFLVDEEKIKKSFMSDYQQELRFPIKCEFAERFKCRYIKPYYYQAFRDEETGELIETVDDVYEVD